MECNRYEAIRAKGIAEKKLTDKDFTGAKKFTLKAQTLYHKLDGFDILPKSLSCSLTCKSILPRWKQAKKIYYWDLTSGYPDHMIIVTTAGFKVSCEEDTARMRGSQADGLRYIIYVSAGCVLGSSSLFSFRFLLVESFVPA
nr:DnaJ domain-containing protein [Tanacetum cinerariifolium]